MTLVAAAVAAAAGVALLVVGVLSFLDASSTRDDADALEEESDEIQAEADAAQQAAESLPELTADLTNQTAQLPETFRETVAVSNALADCLGAVSTVEAFSSCVDQHRADYEAAIEAETALVQEFGVTLADAETAVEQAGAEEGGE